jgi:hypothetical protein
VYKGAYLLRLLPQFGLRGYQVNIPAALKRCGIETKLIIFGEDTPQAHPNSVKAIQGALAKALVWNLALVTGRHTTPGYPDQATQHVRVALQELAEGKPVSTPVTKPYGCSVKYQ